jgi:hypothetical protein
MWSCPFCGRTGQRSKEHVWPRWLQKYPAAKALMNGYMGERYQRQGHLMYIDPDDRFQMRAHSREHQSTLLPSVQVPVCRNCNSGWMSRLEIAAQDILDPMIRVEEVEISIDSQIVLATWASKCMYAYASEWDFSNRPWLAGEYRDLMVRREPSARAYIWMGYSTADTARVAASLIPIFLAPLATPGDQVGTVPPGGANGYLAAHSVVFLAHWLPEAAVQAGFWEEFFDTVRAGLTRIWPPYEPIGWPMPDISGWQLARQRDYLPDMFQEAGFHLAGRTPAEVQQIEADIEAGMSVEDVHSKWGGLG